MQPLQKRYQPLRWTLAASLGLGLGASSFAQDPAPGSSDAEDEIFELSPFTVEGSQDEGYRASSTLAGTRIRTDLKDVGSAISVYTEEFLQDVGATDTSTLLQYTTNAQVAGTRGTYAGLGNGADLDESSSLRNPSTSNRVRGLAAADNTRDFYITDIPWDSYNVNRIDVQRGPNAILFGLGSPAGIINATLAGASYEDEGKVDIRFGSYGSLRGNVSLNKVLIEDVLSVRVAALMDNEQFQQEEAFEDDERYYATVRFDPKLFADESAKTSINLKYESGEIDANRPRIVPPNDSVSPWFAPAEVSAANPFGGMGKFAVDYGYNYGTGYTADQPYLSSGGINQQQPFWLMDGASGQVYDVLGGYINPGARNADGTVRGPSQGLVGKRYSEQFFAVNSLANAAKNANLVNSQYGQYRTMSMSDSSIFDFNNHLIDGDTKSEFEDWDAYNIDFAQTLFGDRLGFQLSYDKQEYARGGEALLGGTPTISIDLTQHFLDLSANPNFGRPFVTSNAGGNGTSYESDRKYTRAAVFGEFRADDVFESDSFLAKLIGKHRVSAVFSQEDYRTDNKAWNRVATDQAWAGYWNGNDGSTSSITDRPPVGIIYLGDSVAGLNGAAGAKIPGINGSLDIASAPVRVFDSNWNATGVNFGDAWVPPANMEVIYPTTATYQQNANPANYVGWTDRQLNLLRYDNGADPSLLTRAQLSQRETKSEAISWQGFLWNGAVVPTFGWRQDEVKSRGVTAGQIAANRNLLNLSNQTVGTAGPYVMPSNFDAPSGSVFEDESLSGGLVVHVNQLFSNDPLPLNVSLSYNKSSNFQVTDTRRDLYGNPIANPTGKTTDYGISLSTKDGKYAFRAVKYESEVKLASSGLSDAGGIGRVVQQGLRFRNVFLYDLGGYDWGSRDAPQGRNTWGGSEERGDPVNGADQTLTPAQGRALEDAAITSWNNIQGWLDQRGFFEAWGFTPVPLDELTDRSTYEANPSAWTPSDTSLVYTYGATQPQGFTVTADTLSEGYEFELTANPTDNWRIAFNAAKSEAVRTNVGGPLLDEFVAYLDEQLTGTPAGNMPQFGNTGLSIYANVFSPWRANYAQMKLSEGTNVAELREWNYNFVTNYSFTDGALKGVGVGGSYRWQDKVGIGYPLVPLNDTEYTFDIDRPIYGPTEDAIDLWASYERELTDRIHWRVQLNIRNAFADDELIPISMQPDNKTWASVRIAPVQEWFITNTFSF